MTETAEAAENGNVRNGTRAKTVFTEVGPVQIDVPRARDPGGCNGAVTRTPYVPGEAVLQPDPAVLTSAYLMVPVSKKRGE